MAKVELTGGLEILQSSAPHPARYPHRHGIDRVVPGNGEEAYAIRHHDMLALPNKAKTCLLKRPHGELMMKAG
jgi:hypothetical protein